MSQYMLLIYDDPSVWESMGEEQSNAMMGEYFAYTQELRESGAIEADADSVILLHIPEEEPHIVEAAMAKGRSTAKGTVNLMMQGHYSRLVERWSPSKALGAA